MLARAASLGLVALAIAGCPTNSKQPVEPGSTTGDATTTTDAVDPTTTTAPVTTESTVAADTSSSTGDDGTIDGECSIWDQDCAAGEKCAPWSAEADLIPDEIRCCPEDANAVQPGDDCVVEGHLGSCLDNCQLGSMCLDFDGDGMGTCAAFCQGSADNPQCEPDQTCLIYFAGVPFCFDQCDPLLQECPEGDGCYPDEEAPGGTGFICLPTLGGTQAGGLCWLLSSCAPGLICVTPDFIPDCNENFGCCTPLCDTTEEPDPCPDVDPALACVSWYIGGQEPPDAAYQNVGACVIPP